MSIFKIFIILSLISAFFSNLVFAQTMDREQLQDFVTQFIKNNTPLPTRGKINVSVSTLDPRIIIKPCLTPLIANIPENHNGRNVNVKINCDDPSSWYLYIPAKIKVVVPVVVAKSIISKGSRLDKSNVTVEYRDSRRIRGESLNDTKIVIGTKAKRRLSAGSILTKKNICFVCKGSHVTLIAQSKTLTIKTSGIALEDGGLGEQIGVENEGSGRTVTGRVSAINEVIIKL
ncbi:flagellar basal body P-ring formation chaperone FlgA [Colwellia hornerae]|uniref:Flagella basal body P-ring formation protein FlgA n=1 Tax=Colwellia hornerae TaxID=89402 RepID=A0A5C6Q4H9_9GAMM|nr:flagellar basal body P-ring formation chaperone FlgA [Colwellia hornerae]TWX54149.1 flagellar basal body P-ring formation protein FlgA [Colwellia hornerae]TWX60924.1 flagellar basal body P-ring formation protein FlgA [Colwellia hornerae]TWX63661.1 flagellar basal body P-ring formation protein FlgA [Colwellia hornerae]